MNLILIYREHAHEENKILIRIAKNKSHKTRKLPQEVCEELNESKIHIINNLVLERNRKMLLGIVPVVQ